MYGQIINNSFLTKTKQKRINEQGKNFLNITYIYIPLRATRINQAAIFISSSSLNGHECIVFVDI